MTSIHHLYVQHLLHGRQPIKHGSGIYTFGPVQDGSGWFGDRWNDVKNIYHSHVKPILISGKNELSNIASKALARGALAALEPENMSIKDRLAHAGRTTQFHFAKDTTNLGKAGKQLVRRKLINEIKRRQ